MYRKIPFVEAERQVIGTRPGRLGNVHNIYNTPVTPRENIHALFEDRHPYWLPMVTEVIDQTPMCYNMNLGRGRHCDNTDAFGIKWKFVEQVGGSIEEPGQHFLETIDEWKDKVKIPDIEGWDWAKEVQDIKVDPRFSLEFTFINGFWFERLISFMDFMDAAMALIDEDYADDIKGLFDSMSELGCKLVDKFCTLWPMLDVIESHDDWGSQKSPFFSQDVAEEFFVPAMRKLNDRIHDWGRITFLHSCGHNADRTQAYIDAGFDYWGPQDMNDIEYLYNAYGDKIVLGVFPQETNLAELTEDEQRKAARDLADKYCKPGKPVMLGMPATRRVTPAFSDELYRYSRQIYLDE